MISKRNYKFHYIFFLAVICTAVVSCSVVSNNIDGEVDPLITWNDTKVKSKIISFVDEVTNPRSNYFVLPSKRIAVFDLDGTLLCEKPMYLNGIIAIEYMKRKIAKDSTLIYTQPYKAVYENDMKFLWSHPDMFLLADYQGKPQSEYMKSVKKFMENKIHPTIHLPYKYLFYQPILDLISFLKAKGFQVYIVSTAEQGFIQSFCEEYLNLKKII